MTSRTSLFLVVSLFVISSNGIFVWINYQAERSRFQSFLEEKSQYLGRLFEATLEDTALRMQQTAAYIASVPEIQQTFYAGRQAVIAEGGGGGGMQAQLARCKLLMLVSNPWEELQRLYDTRQLHFQFGTAATSFLRVEQPDEFGDDLADVRFTIQDALRLEKPTLGFECGRALCGIRGVVPVKMSDPAATEKVLQIGVLEAGTSYQSLLTLVEKSSLAHFAVLLTLDHLRETMWPHHLTNYVANNPAIDGYLVEASLHQRTHTLLNDACVQAIVHHFSVSWCHIDQSDIALAAFPLRDYRGQNDLKRAPVGVILSWYDVTNDIKQLKQDLYTNIFYAVAVLIVIEILLFFTFRTITRKS
ncbi:hypothetical protein CKO12_00480 [Chromatium okenii]|uniref:cache domain-containing protein n=1 Tax=Chromatium okenii TaxID=61644 RepID=UPI0019082A2C|nr:cache domain-containing protein [Chromatium okenii]MBK1640382.1 hypothetical protein [Chromatium okenii]